MHHRERDMVLVTGPRWQFFKSQMYAVCLLLSLVAASRRLDASTAVSTTNSKASTAAAWGGGGRHRQAHHPHMQHTQPIRIGLSIDDYSLRDFLIVMASVLAAAEHPNRVIFHLVACAKDMDAAKALQQQVLRHQIMAKLETR